MNKSYKVFGGHVTVDKNLVAGFLKSIYNEALEKEFENQNINYHFIKEWQVYYNYALLRIIF
tara:strand:+ start:307 stop:492 length:186 start_codon:yes stop_codon:yes gene_type:complete